MIVYEYKSYIEFVIAALHRGKASVPHGAVKELAEGMQCHPTFISQVIRRKAHFNHEQAIRFCSHIRLSDEDC